MVVWALPKEAVHFWAAVCGWRCSRSRLLASGGRQSLPSGRWRGVCDHSVLPWVKCSFPLLSGLCLCLHFQKFHCVCSSVGRCWVYYISGASTSWSLSLSLCKSEKFQHDYFNQFFSSPHLIQASHLFSLQDSDDINVRKICSSSTAGRSTGGGADSQPLLPPGWRGSSSLLDMVGFAAPQVAPPLTGGMVCITAAVWGQNSRLPMSPLTPLSSTRQSSGIKSLLLTQPLWGGFWSPPGLCKQKQWWDLGFAVTFGWNWAGTVKHFLSC